MPAFRRMTLGDERSVLELNAQAVPAVASLDSLELRRLCRISQRHTVVENELGIVVAYAMIFDHLDDYDGEEFRVFRREVAEEFVYVDQIVVSATARGSGIGRGIYEHARTVAATPGPATLCCEVNLVPPNPQSEAFHRHIGFERLQTLNTSDGRIVQLLVKRAGTGFWLQPARATPDAEPG